MFSKMLCYDVTLTSIYFDYKYCFGNLLMLGRWKNGWHCATWLLKLEERMVLFLLTALHINILRFVQLSWCTKVDVLPLKLHLYFCILHLLLFFLSMSWHFLFLFLKKIVCILHLHFFTLIGTKIQICYCLVLSSECVGFYHGC